MKSLPKKITEAKIEYMKQYRLEKKDEIKRQKQEYYKNNKDKFNDKKLASLGEVR